jgi:DNA-binding transcriptional ArsR family regulator
MINLLGGGRRPSAVPRIVHHMAYSSSALDRSFNALSHPARRRLLEVLTTGPASVGEASHGLGLSKAAITKHVHVL